jgi:hypothetical protein
MTACTWNPTCPCEGTHRLEHTGFTGGSVEFVCDEHFGPAEAQGYRRPREPGNHQGTIGPSDGG